MIIPFYGVRNGHIEVQIMRDAWRLRIEPRCLFLEAELEWEGPVIRHGRPRSWQRQVLMSECLASYPGTSKPLCFSFFISKMGIPEPISPYRDCVENTSLPSAPWGPRLFKDQPGGECEGSRGL